MNTYLLTAFLENLFDRSSLLGFILGGLIALAAIILVVVIALVPLVLLIKLVLFIIRKSNDISENRLEKWESSREEREKRAAEKEFSLAKENFIRNLPKNLPECARAVDTMKELAPLSSEALRFLKEAENMLLELKEKGEISFGEKNAVFGDSTQQYFEGIRCLRENNKKKALEWFLVGAEKGHITCQRHCASIYAETDHKKAMYWFERVAENGDTDDMISFAKTYLMGELCEKDYIKAGEWYRKAGDKGDAESYHKAAICYSAYAAEYAERNGIKEGDKVEWNCPALKYANLAEKCDSLAAQAGYTPEK